MSVTMLVKVILETSADVCVCSLPLPVYAFSECIRGYVPQPLCVCMGVYLYGWLLWLYCMCVPVSLRVCGPVNSCGSCNTTVMLCVVLEGPDYQMANTSLPMHTAILNTHTHTHSYWRD